jgi:arsenite methyltransferase
MTDTRQEVRARYAEAARRVVGSHASSSCCGTASDVAPSCCGEQSGASCCGGSASEFGSTLYDESERDALPEHAVLASLGCGNPIAVAELREGETVLDLGSGGGIDVLLSAARVGPTGKVFGLDMTREMLELARANQAEAGAHNVEFLEGYIEAIPLPADSVDVVISNCVVNLAADKEAVFREVSRVLRSGGRIGITDVVASNELTPGQRAERGSYTGCIAGALSFLEYEQGLRRAGLADVEMSPTHEVASGMFSAIVRASKPAVRAPGLG